MTLALPDSITVTTAEPVFARLKDQVAGIEGEIQLDLSAVEELDSAGLAVLVRLRDDVRARGGELRVEGASPSIQALLDLARFEDGAVRPEPSSGKPPNELQKIGELTLDALADLGDLLSYIGRVTLALIWAIGHPRKVRWDAVALHVQETGANALPIVALLSALVGLVIAFSSAVQLAQFGANIFIVDLIGIGVARELGPLMAAILLIARSGSAFAAEIGTQKISEEIDALTVMGLKPVPYLVIPRILATLITLPLLTIFADIAGVIGGMVIGAASLDVGPTVFVARLQEAVSLWDVASGVLKSFFFAILIAGVGCYRGMETSGGAMGVGRATTSSVVSGIFLLVIADSVFVVLFHYLGLDIG